MYLFHRKVRIGHFVEAQILEALGIDFIDESEVLTPADGNVNTSNQTKKIRKLWIECVVRPHGK
jgi:pyridoxal biosynthesis lyase PdxS